MRLPQLLVAVLAVVAALVASAATVRTSPPGACTMHPGRSMLLVRVDHATREGIPATTWKPAPGAGLGSPGWDSLLATPDTPMPTARVTVLRADSATRAAFSRAGIEGERPSAIIRAAPFRHDCRAVRWTSAEPWVQVGDTGYLRGTLALRDGLADSVPLFFVAFSWNYPYPFQRGLLYRTPPDEPIAAPDAVYSLDSALELGAMEPRPAGVYDSLRRARGLAWLRTHLEVADLAPIRSRIRTAILDADWARVQQVPSRFRGSYLVTMQSDGVRGSWFFRTHNRPGYGWSEAPGRSAAQLLASPYVAAYSLAGHATRTRGELRRSSPGYEENVPKMWLSAADAPTAPGNEGRLVLPGMLEFELAAAPEPLWDVLADFIPTPDPRDAQFHAAIPLKDRQPRLPITLRLGAAGGVRGDTTLLANGRQLRVRLERLDTLSLPRGW